MKIMSDHDIMVQLEDQYGEDVAEKFGDCLSSSEPDTLSNEQKTIICDKVLTQLNWRWKLVKIHAITNDEFIWEVEKR